MASLNQVAIELQVRGEREATQALKRYSSASDKLTRSVLDAAAKVENTSNAWDRANKLFEKGVLNTKGLQAAQTQLARELAVVNGYVKSNGALNTQKALAELKAVEATKQAAAAEAQANAERQRAQQSYQQLRAAIDPTYAAQMRLKKAHDTVRAALRQGIITRDQAAESLRQYRAQAQMGSVGVRGFGDANHIASRQTNAAGMAMQQAGYQVGDFVVQVQSGTNAFVAFGQQATQLVGVLPMLASQFGMNVTRLIAISSVLGVVIPIVTALGAAFMRTRGQAKNFSATLDELKTSINDYKSAIDDARTNTSDLRKRFGSVTESMRPFINDLQELERIRALNNLNDTFQKLEVSSKNFMDTLREGLVSVSFATEKRIERLGLNIEQYEQITSLVNEIKSAETSSDRINSAKALRDALKETFGSLDAMTLEMQAFYGDLVQTILASGELEANIDGAAGATEDTANSQQRLNDLLEKGRQAAFERARTNRQAIIDMENELKLQQEIARYGEDSVEVVRMRAEQEAIAKNLTEENQQEYIDLAVEIFNAKRATEETADAAAEIGPALQGAINQANAFANAIDRAADRAAGIGISTAGLEAERRALERGRTEAEAAAIGAATSARERILATVDRPGPRRDEMAQREFDRIYATELANRQAQQLLNETRDALLGSESGSDSGSGRSEQARELERVQKIFNDLYDSSEAYRGRLTALQEQYQSGQLSIEQYREGMEQLKEAISDGTYVLESAQQALIDYSANATKYGDEIASALTNAFKGAEDALTDFVMTGKLDFASLANSIVADITRIAIRSAILGPLANSLGGALGGGGLGGLGGGLGSIFAGVFHNGGIVGAGGNAGRQVSAAAFIGAPRYHEGGIAGLKPNEVPAILERGERITPKEEVDRGRNITVNMTINTPDANSFRRSENQVASMARMALQRAERNM